MPVKANGFQDRLVMTASIILRMLSAKIDENNLSRYNYALYIISIKNASVLSAFFIVIFSLAFRRFFDCGFLG